MNEANCETASASKEEKNGKHAPGVKTLFILGAGSTASFGIPTTKGHIAIFKKYKGQSDELKRLQKIVAGLFGTSRYGIADVYNLVDSSIALNTDLRYEDLRLTPLELQKAKKDFIGYLFDDFGRAMDPLKEKKTNKSQLSVNFYKALAEIEIEKKSKKLGELGDRENFIADYSIVNLNWDLYSIMPIIEAHKDVNKHAKNAKGGEPQLRIYTDFGCECASRSGEGLWYPFTEPVANVVNSKDWGASRRAVLVKAIYPHGLMNLFRCPHCGKHSFYMGDDLSLPGVLRGLDESPVYQCPYCGTEIRRDDFDVLVQSNFKVRNSYLEELRLSFQTELSNADRIVFIGYSLPEDDIEMRTLFKAYCSGKDVYVVCYDQKRPTKDFVSAKRISSRKAEIVRYKKVFDNDRLFFDTKGFPDATVDILKLFEKGNPSKEDI